MMDLMRMVALYVNDGYSDLMARARVCQDVVLKAISESSMSKNITIKGGVVVRSISGDMRRATRDIDLDFLRFSIEEAAIRDFVMKINCIEDLSIDIEGPIEELSQHEYRGKRIWIVITDSKGHSLKSKMDLGVHKNIQIEQEEYCFDVCHDAEGVSLLMNTTEQIFAEKLRALVKFGTFTGRYKDIFDLCYLAGHTEDNRLIECIHTYILDDTDMFEDSMDDIRKRLEKIFSDKKFVKNLARSTKDNWLGIDESEAFMSLQTRLEKLN